MAVLAVPVKIPIVWNGRELGNQTAPVASKVTVLREDPSTGKVLIKTALGEAWVPAACIQKPDVDANIEPAANQAAPPKPPSPTLEATPSRQESPASAKAVQTVKPGSLTTPEKFTISVKGTDVEVRQFGRGETGIIFFNNSGPMDDLIAGAISEYSPLLDKGCSLFLWRYPEVAPFDDVQTTIQAWMGGGEKRLDFTGVATAVADGIRKKTGLKKLLLVGNSLGGGMLLWDYPKLSAEAGIQFLLISPTEMFMPDPATLTTLKHTVLIADEKSDPFTRSKSLKTWLASNKSELMKKVTGRGHIIIGEDGLDHKKLVELISLSLEPH